MTTAWPAPASGCCLLAALLLALSAPSVSTATPTRSDARLVELSDGGLGIEIVAPHDDLIRRFDKLDAEERRSVMQVRSISDDGEPSPLGMLGTVEVRAGRIVFVPRFPLVPGLSYRVGLDGAVLATLAVPPTCAPRAEVVAFFPSSEQVPANLLRIYLHFSQPMARGEAYRRIELLREDGSVISDPFLEIDEELWDGDQRRLTLFFDPGRIKRGLRPHDELGPPLAAGDRLRLVVDGDWADGFGRPLVTGFEKRLEVISEDRRSPRLDAWRLDVPAAGTRDALEILFAEPLDHALALRMISIERASGEAVLGSASLVENERRWRFLPAEPWDPGGYQISADGALEDVAGNSLRGTFDRDLEQGDAETRQERFVKPFEVALPATHAAGFFSADR